MLLPRQRKANEKTCLTPTKSAAIIWAAPVYLIPNN